MVPGLPAPTHLPPLRGLRHGIVRHADGHPQVRAELEPLDVMINTGREIMVEWFAVVSSQASNPGKVTLHAGSAMRLQQIRDQHCPLVSTGLHIITDAPTSTGKTTLIQERKNGTTKLRQLGSKGTVSVETDADRTTMKNPGSIISGVMEIILSSANISPGHIGRFNVCGPDEDN